MGFHDVAFLPPRANFPPTFLNNCHRGDSLITTTCLKTVIMVSNGTLPVKYFSSNKASFCVSGMSWRSQSCQTVEVNMATLSFGVVTGFKTVVSSSCCFFIQPHDYFVFFSTCPYRQSLLVTNLLPAILTSNTCVTFFHCSHPAHCSSYSCEFVS